MAFTPPTVADFKSRFDRDFAFCADADQTNRKRVRDRDVTLAFTQAQLNFNPGLFPDQDTFAEASLLIAAHFLTTNLMASSQGLRGQGEWLVNSKAAGNLSSAFSIPDKILRSPTLSLYSRTLYGCQYLTLIAPFLVGNVLGVVRNAHAT